MLPKYWKGELNKYGLPSVPITASELFIKRIRLQDSLNILSFKRDNQLYE